MKLNKRKVLKFAKARVSVAFFGALKLSDECWKMRDEAMKQDDTVTNGEGADDWDFICLPIPGDEDGSFCGEFEDDEADEDDNKDEEEGEGEAEGETASNAEKENDKKSFDKLASLHPDWPWFFTMSGVDRFKWWQQECLKRIQDDFGFLVHNYIGV
ncbi:uncharacterized protein BKA55DRAFT_694505 [Fusarium redolens]|uniref:Uncharacterized protein n=1 Tax=Fusarium redolens TaxID=48865 RepID=A0A9P9GE80_FUSRE|nr:uncharacterized protein BKA55DRAFT_694505 [Fusarium redolens]KAH7236882.1 hypothetical protein BKA55DRAFT_694505 [Fusarium redolens]